MFNNLHNDYLFGWVRGNQRHNMDEKAIQSAHSGSIPRVGGLAIYLAF